MADKSGQLSPGLDATAPSQQLRSAGRSESNTETGPRQTQEDDSEEVPTLTDDVAAEATDLNERLSITNSHQAEKDGSADLENPEQPQEAVYSVFKKPQRIGIVVAVSLLGFLSPLTGSIYLPAMNSIAADLGVRTSLINLTITTYQIFQGLAPSFIATLSDTRGRRPAYVLAMVIYIIANLALGLQHSYPALLVLRCLQSAGSSATIALGSATVSDMVTRAERGSYIGWTSLGISLGPALGPVLGGILDQYLGWRAIFWMLLILGGVFLIVVVTTLPETCRPLVGNGSVRPKAWNLTILQWMRERSGRNFTGSEDVVEDRSTINKPRRRPNPISSLKILMEPEGGVTLGMGAFLFAGYFMLLTTLSEELTARFGYDSAIVGLCYLPLGFGSLISRWLAGQLFDWNFRRHAKLLHVSLDLTRQQSMRVYPIERIRLEICIPMVYISCGTVLAYAWAMEKQASLAGIEVALFFLGLFFSGALQGFNLLIVDTHSDTPGTATAANNLFRCLLSAGATAVAPFMINRIGIGYMGVFISGVWLVISPCLWIVMIYGKKWRMDAAKKREVKEALRREKEAGRAV